MFYRLNAVTTMEHLEKAVDPKISVLFRLLLHPRTVSFACVITKIVAIIF